MSRVVLAMSGGVDSSVAAHLLLAAGHEVIGVFMRHGNLAPTHLAPGEHTGGDSCDERTPGPGHTQGCCSAADAADARRVADRLDIPFYALNLQEQFDRIIVYFVEEYTAGRTPNPCVVCNHWLKFGKLFDYADSVGADYVATGHYAQLVRRGSGQTPALLRGHDSTKDQSYVLFGIQRSLLARMMLPVGGYTKTRIREIAAELGMAVAGKRDSQEICFVAPGKHAELVRARQGDVDTSGQIVTTAGQVVGQHRGIESYTIGQRKGLGVALGEPHFVVRIEADTRRVVIGKREELARDCLTAQRTNWLADEPAGPVRCQVQIRYNSAAAPATVGPLPAGRMTVAFDEPQYGIAPGQAVVCYDEDRVLGGGWIE